MVHDPTDHSVIKHLERVYASLPSINCKGLCWNSCGPIDMSDVERQRIVDLGVDIPLFTEERSHRWGDNEKGELYCPALSFGAHEGGGMGCTVHEVRPLICRVWGLGEDDMACPHGCERTGSLTHPEIYRLLAETMTLGGHPDMDMARGMATMEALLNDPECADLVARMMAGDMSVAPEIETAVRKLQGT